ncbi:MAG: hypothetical protein HQL35_01860 [Alphaproteobacteria bacterium]|nr:hypothetical protein [Alphaproteobacteria bacterium]
MVKQGSHEDFSRASDVRMGSERSFGIVFAVVFGLVGGWQHYNGNVDWGVPVLGVGGAFLLVALAVPALLRPLNVLWFKLGLLLHKVVSPLVLGLLFFVTVTPIALLMKVFGKDPLSLRLDPQADSYWIRRDPPGPAPKSMSKQF